MTASAPITLERPEGRFRLTLPDWGAWLSIIDAASRGEGEGADVDLLLRRWLKASTEVCWTGGDRFGPLNGIADLPAALADALVAAGAEALEAEREALALDREMLETGEIRVASTAGDFTLHPLSFAERNAALRMSLSVTHGEATLDAGFYEQVLVARSIRRTEDGEAVKVTDLRALPLALGEALVTAARELSDPAADEELRAFAEAGQMHPDLELANLCLAYGISPAEAEALPAATARRLGAAARLLAASAPQPIATSDPVEAMPDNMTRIVVTDG
ncbi:MAG: hypothetical protein AAF479_11155 [Pseudomonadota bacterium]